MPAPTIVSHSFATATDDTFITIPAPPGLEEHHSLVSYLAAEFEHHAPPWGLPTGWVGATTEDQVGVGAADIGFGSYIAMSYTLDYVGGFGLEADYTFQVLTTPGFGGVPPANETPFLVAHGHLLALDRGLGGSIARGESDTVLTADSLDFGPSPDLVAPPSLVLNFVANGTGPSSPAFGTVVADEGFTKIGAYDTTGMAAGDSLGARTISGAVGAYHYANWAQLEEVFGTPVEPPVTTLAAWGVLAR